MTLFTKHPFLPRLALVQFKRGGFSPGTPVQPVAVSYPGQVAPLDLTTWTWNQPHGYMVMMWLLLANPVNRVQV